MTSLPKARTAEEIRVALKDALDQTDHTEMAKQCMLAALPALGAIIEEAREHRADIRELREGIIATVTQVIVDVVLLTTRETSLARMGTLQQMLAVVNRAATITLARVQITPEAAQ